MDALQYAFDMIKYELKQIPHASELLPTPPLRFWLDGVDEKIDTFDPPAPKLDPETEIWLTEQKFTAVEKDWIRRCDAGLKASAELQNLPTEAEDLYCICAEREYGLMIECCNEGRCLGRQWYHIGCLGLDQAPDGEWACPRCKTVDQRANAWARYTVYLQTRSNGVDFTPFHNLVPLAATSKSTSQVDDTPALRLGEKFWLDKTFDPGRCKLRRKTKYSL